MSSRRLLGGGGPSGPERSGGEDDRPQGEQAPGGACGSPQPGEAKRSQPIAAPASTRTWGGEADPSGEAGTPAKLGKFPGSADPTGDLRPRIARVFKHLKKWAKRTGVTCFRIYEKDLPDQPLIVDWYDGDAVVWTYHRTRNETPADERAWLAAVDAAVGDGLGLPKERIWRRERRQQKDRQEGEGQYQILGRQGVTKTVLEHGLKFEVNLSDYLDTGLFLDHRPTRQRVGTEATGKDVLNLFAYTGAFTCHAAVGGAKSTTTVDLSNTYLAWAGRNLELNGFAEGPRHRIIKADVVQWLVDERGTWDLIICDPPTFSNSTSMTQSWSVDRDHPWLLDRLLARLRPGGVLYFSTNSRGFRLEWPVPPGITVADISAPSIPEDFRNTAIHRCWRIVRTPG